MKYSLEIPLEYEDELGFLHKIDIVGVNQMYTGGSIRGRKGKRLTPEAIKYKNHLKKYVEKFREESNWDKDFDLNDKLFYTVEFYLNVPINKSKKIDKRYLRDADNLIKPIQDSLESDGDIKRIWENDKNIRSLLPHVVYNQENSSKIKINIYKYSKDKIDLLLDFIDNNF